MNEPTNKPAHEIRLSGGIKATIWANQSPNGTWYSTTIARLYKEGEQWKTASSFGRDDLLVVAKIADQAHTWVCEQRKEPAE